jgi:hypothetical protein
MAKGKTSAIIGFHQDEHEDWIAELSCGHNQHVRHQPPWTLRPWVVNEAGRKQHLGPTLMCRECGFLDED